MKIFHDLREQYDSLREQPKLADEWLNTPPKTVTSINWSLTKKNNTFKG